jgi:hypothetical protein
MLQSVFAIVLAVSLVQASSRGVPLELRDCTAEEEAAACAAATKALTGQNLWHGKIYLTNLEVIFDNRPSPPDRFALLTFYRYDGDLAILVSVHLDKMIVSRVTQHPHMPTCLAPEEIAAAESLARSHPDIKRALGKFKHLDNVEADVNVAMIVNSQAPGYQHRVARLWFRDANRNGLPNVPMVEIDLTSGEVRVDVIRGTHEKKKA